MTAVWSEFSLTFLIECKRRSCDQTSKCIVDQVTLIFLLIIIFITYTSYSCDYMFIAFVVSLFPLVFLKS